MQFRFLFLVFLLSTIFVSARFNKNGDFQIWETHTLEKTITDSFGIRIDNELRIGDDISRVFYLYVQGFLVYRPYNWLILSPGYRQEWLRKDGALKPQYVPQFDTYFIYVSDKIVITNRNRLGYLFRYKEFNSIFYRGRLRFSFPLRKESLFMQPYIDNEIFIIQGRGFNQNRSSIGVLFKVTDHFDPRFYYMVRLDKENGSWKQINIIGLHLYFTY